MSVEEDLVLKAVQQFWDARRAASERQSGRDIGARREVTAGGHFDGFIDGVAELVQTSEIPLPVDIHRRRGAPVLPGYFRPEKEWDIVIICDGQLGAAIELKAQVGPSFGNNFNNRAEEALGSANDFWTAYREGAFGEQPPPWLGYLFLLEDHARTRTPVRAREPLYPIMSEFRDSSYAIRYEWLFRKMQRERAYTATAMLLSKRPEDELARFHTPASDLSPLRWLRSLVGHLRSLA